MPVFSAGKLMGYRRKRNDALLIFCLRHYGQDAEGKRTTINYFSTRASAGAAGGADGPTPGPSGAGLSPGQAFAAPDREREGGFAGAEASTTTVRTVITGKSGRAGSAAADAAAEVLNGFEGVRLDAEAAAAIARALEDCAARARAADAACEAGGAAAAEALADDPGESFFRSEDYHGELLPPCLIDEFVPFVEGEPHWQLAGAEKPEMLVAWEDEQARRTPGPAEDVRGTSSVSGEKGREAGAVTGVNP